MGSFHSMPHRTGTGIALLADPTRRRIIALVAVKPRRPSAIARDLGVHRSTATHQLRLLEEAGLIMRRRTFHDGRGVLYVLDPRRVGHVLAWLAGTEVGGPFDALATDSSGPPPSERQTGSFDANATIGPGVKLLRFGRNDRDSDLVGGAGGTLSAGASGDG